MNNNFEADPMRTQFTGEVDGRKVTLNFAAATCELLLQRVKHQLANSYLDRPELEAVPLERTENINESEPIFG